jgi:DNA-binding transcriptional ArsR family regulator
MVTHDTDRLAIIRDPDAALALLDPERRRLAEALAEAPDSASGLARRLGEKRQRLNYHLRVLEEAGLVEVVEERRSGSRSERVLRLSARRFVLDPAAAGAVAPADPVDGGDRFSAGYLVALAARAIRELADLLERASRSGTRLATASLNTRVRVATPARFEAFVGDLTQAVAEVVARHHEEQGEGRWFRVVAGAYPGPAPSADTEGRSDGRVDGSGAVHDA